MKGKINWIGLWQELAKKIKKYYPYFLIFYIAVLLFAVIFPAARAYFYWPGLHGAFIVLTILAALSYYSLRPKAAQPIAPPPSDLRAHSAANRAVVSATEFFKRFKIFIPRTARTRLRFVLVFSKIFFKIIRTIFLISSSGRRFIFCLRRFFHLLSRPFGRFLVRSIAQIKAFKRRDWLKVLIVILIAAFGLYKGVSAWEFVVLFYAACSLVYILDSRWAAAVALVFLAACPVLLISDREILAEDSAVSAFYFLVITVLTQIRELQRDKGRGPEEEGGEIE